MIGGPAEALETDAVLGVVGDVESGGSGEQRGAGKAAARSRQDGLSWWMYVADVVLLVVVGICTAAAEAAEPKEMGFFLGDPSIALSLRGNTVPSWAVLVMGVGVPVVAAALAAPVFGRWETFWRVFRFAMLGSALTFLVTDLVKVTVGSPRPNFLAVCDPDLAANATESLVPQEFTSSICRGSPADVFEARKSFPSGHSSGAAYGLFFVVFLLERFAAKARDEQAVFYLTACLPGDIAMLRPTVQALCAVVPFYVAATRVSDHKHRFLDVLVGLAIGVAVAYVTVYRMIALHVGLDLAVAGRWARRK
jgi:phosphatidate phosphatase